MAKHNGLFSTTEKIKMKLNAEQRNILIDALVQDWKDTCMNDPAARDAFFEETLMYGRVGYHDHPDWELVDLCEDADLFTPELDDALAEASDALTL
ncbi:MAG: hypothetical protein WC322_06695 [Candidatus Paceibacterota bacterium]|jgi:hypothetical protein